MSYYINKNVRFTLKENEKIKLACIDSDDFFQIYITHGR